MSATACKLVPQWPEAAVLQVPDVPASTLAVLGASLHERLTAVGASRSLATFGEVAVPVLAEAIRKGTAWTRELAVEALGETGAGAAWTPVMRALHDPEEAVRVAAACAIERLAAAPRIYPPLRAAM